MATVQRKSVSWRLNGGLRVIYLVLERVLCSNGTLILSLTFYFSIFQKVLHEITPSLSSSINHYRLQSYTGLKVHSVISPSLKKKKKTYQKEINITICKMMHIHIRMAD